jgi:hypothetical protein
LEELITEDGPQQNIDQQLMRIDLLVKLCEYPSEKMSLQYQMECLYYIFKYNIITLKFGIEDVKNGITSTFKFPYKIDYSCNQIFLQRKGDENETFTVNSFQKITNEESENELSEKILKYVSKITKLFSVITFNNKLISSMNLFGTFQMRVYFWENTLSLPEFLDESYRFSFISFADFCIQKFSSYAQAQSRCLLYSFHTINHFRWDQVKLENSEIVFRKNEMRKSSDPEWKLMQNFLKKIELEIQLLDGKETFLQRLTGSKLSLN